MNIGRLTPRLRAPARLACPHTRAGVDRLRGKLGGTRREAGRRKTQPEFCAPGDNELQEFLMRVVDKRNSVARARRIAESVVSAG